MRAKRNQTCRLSSILSHSKITHPFNRHPSIDVYTKFGSKLHLLAAHRFWDSFLFEYLPWTPLYRCVNPDYSV